jgi:hypothetical protein
MTIDVDPGFTAHAPEPIRSPEVARFYDQNPELDVGRSLAFVTKNYPDTSVWVIEGGVAVQALTRSRAVQPHDLDIVCQDPTMEAAFGYPEQPDLSQTRGPDRYIDVKTLERWLRRKRLVVPGEPSLWEHVLALSLPMAIEGSPVRVLHPALIAAGKSTLFQGTQRRPKDEHDVQLLAVSDEQVMAATELLLGHDPEKQIDILQSNV